MQLRNLFKKYGPSAGILGLTLVAGPSFAADGDIDITKVMLYMAGGIVAAGTITGAMLGLVSLIGVGKKTQRAGT